MKLSTALGAMPSSVASRAVELARAQDLLDAVVNLESPTPLADAVMMLGWWGSPEGAQYWSEVHHWAGGGGALPDPGGLPRDGMVSGDLELTTDLLLLIPIHGKKAFERSGARRSVGKMGELFSPFLRIALASDAARRGIHLNADAIGESPISVTLCGAFPWDSTPEGIGFWTGVYYWAHGTSLPEGDASQGHPIPRTVHPELGEVEVMASGEVYSTVRTSDGSTRFVRSGDLSIG